MPRPFALPDLGEGLTEAEIVKVLVNEGDVLTEDAPLLEVETDKATVEIPSPFAGRVARIHVQPGQSVKVGDVLVTFEDAAGLAPGGGGGGAAGGAGPGRARRVRARPAARGAGGASRGAAPVSVAAGGPAERAALARPLAAVGVEPPVLPRFEQWGPVERQPLSHLRRTIAERMTLSATLIPHVTHFDRADITELDAIIRRNVEPARERGLTLTLTSFLLKAAALALQEHPQFNASLDPAAGELIVKRYHHLGVAVATERGLIVPVIRDVDHKPLVEVQRELAALAQRVREGKATLEDLRGGTFTITNIGALGGTGAIPIINYPEVAILGVA